MDRKDAHPAIRLSRDVEDLSGDVLLTPLPRRTWEGHPVPNVGGVNILALAASAGLMSAHNHGIIHRDVKPDNIFVPQDSDGFLDLRGAKLGDLGLAQGGQEQTLTMARATMGTPGFMAPEQIRDARQAGPGADVFSMGATIYALLTGDAPYRGDTPMERLLCTLSGKHEPVWKARPDVSAEFEILIESCLQTDLHKRVPNPDELFARLLQIRGTVPTDGDAPRSQIETTAAVRQAALEGGPGAAKKMRDQATLEHIRMQLEAGQTQAPAAQADRLPSEAENIVLPPGYGHLRPAIERGLQKLEDEAKKKEARTLNPLLVPLVVVCLLCVWLAWCLWIACGRPSLPDMLEGRAAPAHEQAPDPAPPKAR